MPLHLPPGFHLPPQLQTPVQRLLLERMLDAIRRSYITPANIMQDRIASPLKRSRGHNGA